MTPFSPFAKGESIVMATHLKRIFLTGLMLTVSAHTPAATPTGPLDVAQSPLFIGIQADPNIMLVSDESGMPGKYAVFVKAVDTPALSCPFNSRGALRACVAEEPCRDVTVEQGLRNWNVNALFYNPSLRYDPWIYPAATPSFVNAPITAAPDDPLKIYNPSQPGGTPLPPAPVANTAPTKGMDGYTYPLCPSLLPGPSTPNTAVNFTLYDATTRKAYDAYYYRYNGGAMNVASNYTRVDIIPENGPFNSSAENRLNRTDCANHQSNSCSYAEEIQNFANWYTYYRGTGYAARAALGTSFSKLDRHFRVGYGSTAELGVGDYTSSGPAPNTYIDRHTDSSPDPGISPGTVIYGVRPFEGAHLKRVYDALYARPSVLSTNYQRRAVSDVGKYFMRRDQYGPWSDNPETGVTVTPHLSCRQNYMVMVSGSFWREAERRTGIATRALPPTMTNADNEPGVLVAKPDGTSVNTYNPGAPESELYKDAWSGTLADYSMYYWKNDLRPDLDNNVQINSDDPAFWQHMVIFGITVAPENTGLVNTTAPLATLRNYFISGGSLATSPCQGVFYDSVGNYSFRSMTPCEWQYPGLSLNPLDSLSVYISNYQPTFFARLDDFYHAAINSRGRFYLGANTADIRREIQNIVDEIVAKTIASSSSVSANSTRLQNDTLVYQARFNAEQWWGQLLAYEVNAANGAIKDKNGNNVIEEADAVWDAGLTLAQALTASGTAYQNRKIYSYNPTQTACAYSSGAYGDAAATARKGIEFLWANFNCAQKKSLEPTNTGDSASNLVNYLRGDNSKEKDHTDGIYRTRTAEGVFRVLGDIVDSDPFFMGSDDFGYSSLPAASGGSSYLSFLGTKSTRKRVLFVGANDGMLHAFNAGSYNGTTKTFGQGDGAELFAYVPGTLVGEKLAAAGVDAADSANNKLAGRASDPLYHKFLVDGSPVVGDAYFAAAWHSVLLGSTGAGGKAVFALDVTDPNDFSNVGAGTEKILWEITDRYPVDASSNPAYPDMGYSVPQPALARMANGKFAAIVGNGYSSANGKAVLYIVDVQDGSLVKAIEACTPSAASTVCPGVANNGLSSPTPVDVDDDRRVDFVYAGDLLGNLWKFDLRCPGSTPDEATCANSWGVANGGQPLFVACEEDAYSCAANKRQPITVKPQVSGVGVEQSDCLRDGGAEGCVASASSSPSVMVYFGTGMYLQTADATDTQKHTFYGLWDKNYCGDSATVPCTVTADKIAQRGNLQQQTVLQTVTVGSTPSFDLRITSNNGVCYDPRNPANPGTPCTAKSGWYMDLPTSGERMIGNPQYRTSANAGRIVFTSVVPNRDPCSAGGDTWLSELNALTGARLGAPPFDIYGASGAPDGILDSNDNYTDTGGGTPAAPVSPSMMKLQGLSKKTGSSMQRSADEGGNCASIEYIYSSLGTGGVEKTTGQGAACGRQGWRQLR